jgi:hypothetical protein
MPDRADVRDQALQVARGWSPPGAPESWRLTSALFVAISRHDELLDRLAELPPDRLPGLLAAAAICFLVRRDAPPALAAYFPHPGRHQPPFDDRFFPDLAAFCSDRLDDIVAVCRDHRYQMNEVARCAQIALGMAATVTPFADRIGLVDLGSGAGLGLHLDRYRYRIGNRPWVGPHRAGVRVECRLRGPGRPPALRLPTIVERVGIDIDPIDIGDAASRAWLEACAPPEAGALTRLTAAMDVARRHPATILGGDIVDVLPAVLAEMPRGLSIVVVDAYTAVFLPLHRRRLLARDLAQAAAGATITWLSLDPLVPLGPSGRDSVQDLAVPDQVVDDYHRHGVFALLGARTFGGDTEGGRLLARGHPSGAWAEWFDDEPLP